MNLQQLRIVREVVRQEFNLTDASNALFTSQSGASKHIRDLEDELGAVLFERRGKRLLGLTAAGETLVTTVERILTEVENLKRSAYQIANRDQGRLSIATTHTQARYTLPPILSRFRQAYPGVEVALHQCGPQEIVALLKAGKVDLGIATEALHREGPLFACFPFYEWRHGVIVPEGHPLDDDQPLTLDRLAAYPIITYHPGFTGRSIVNDVFRQAGVAPNIVLSALDADVIKTYVELDMGVGVIASVAYRRERDPGLVLRPAEDLFPLNVTHIALRRGRFLPPFVYAFLGYCREDWDEPMLRRAVEPGVG